MSYVNNKDRPYEVSANQVLLENLNRAISINKENKARTPLLDKQLEDMMKKKERLERSI